MPNCFQLFKKGETEATPLNTIDREICILLAKPVDDRRYCVSWFDVIGFAISCGRSLGSDSLRLSAANAYKAYKTDAPEQEAYYRMLNGQLKYVLEYLEKNYTSDAWVEIGRH